MCVIITMIELLCIDFILCNNSIFFSLFELKTISSDIMNIELPMHMCRKKNSSTCALDPVRCIPGQ